MVKFDEQTFKIYDTFSTLVKPKKSIPEVISNITGIYDTDVSDALCFEELKEDIKDFI
jgi:DNA polymerase III epsilon subunit-like protein